MNGHLLNNTLYFQTYHKFQTISQNFRIVLYSNLTKALKSKKKSKKLKKNIHQYIYLELRTPFR